MTSFKKIGLIVATTAAAIVGASAPADARPYYHRHQVCHLERHHHHMVRVCHWVR